MISSKLGSARKPSASARLRRSSAASPRRCADGRVGLAADSFAAFVAGDLAQRLDLVADGGADARHAEVAARAEPRGVELRGVQQEADRRARADANQCRTVSATGSTASWPASGSRMMPEKKPEAALLGLPGRTQIVGRRMPMPSKKPRRRVVGEQQLADRLLGAVAGQRRA